MQSFEQKFVVDNAGTHYWHGHTSLDRMDGLQGLIIIEDPNDPEEQALKELYDEERVIWLQDWWHKSGASLRTSLDSDVFVGPPQSILINGKGRFGTCVENPELPQCDENGFWWKLCASNSCRRRKDIPVSHHQRWCTDVPHWAMANHTMTG